MEPKYMKKGGNHEGKQEWPGGQIQDRSSWRRKGSRWEKDDVQTMENHFLEEKRDLSVWNEKIRWVTVKTDQERYMPKRIPVKLLNTTDKEDILQDSRQKNQITYKGIKSTVIGLLSAMLEAGRPWKTWYKLLREKNHVPRILHPVKMLVTHESERMIFADTQGREEVISTYPTRGGDITQTTTSNDRGIGGDS